MSGKNIKELLAEFGGEPYTRERFEADLAKWTAVIAAKHGIPESDVERLIREHDYEHSAEDPEDEWIITMAFGRAAGWLS